MKTICSSAARRSTPGRERRRSFSSRATSSRALGEGRGAWRCPYGATRSRRERDWGLGTRDSKRYLQGPSPESRVPSPVFMTSPFFSFVRPLAVVAFGGNALLRPGDPATTAAQFARAREAVRNLLPILGRGSE